MTSGAENTHRSGDYVHAMSLERRASLIYELKDEDALAMGGNP
jgi:hypothetical protein